MNFKNLFIHTTSGKLSGKIEFQNELGEIALKLDEQMTQDVLNVCAEALVRVSKQAADEMTATVLEGLGIPLDELEYTPSPPPCTPGCAFEGDPTPGVSRKCGVCGNMEAVAGSIKHD